MPKITPKAPSAHDVRRAPVTDEEIAERAWRATRAFKLELPRMTTYARALTGRSVQVEMTAGTPCTDGKTIWLRPPIEFGDQLTHGNRAFCIPARDENYVPLCGACAAHENVLITLLHEIAHIAYGSFDEVSERDARELIAKMADDAIAGGVADSHAEFAKSHVTGDASSYIEAANKINPFLGIILNCWEDAAVNRKTIDARPGTFSMFQHQTRVIFDKGIQGEDGSWSRWDEAHPDMQAMIGLFCRASGYETKGWFIPEIEEFLNSPEVAKLLFQFKTARSAKARYRLCFPTLEVLRAHGYCHRRGEKVTMTMGTAPAATDDPTPGKGAKGDEPQEGDEATQDAGADSTDSTEEQDGSETGDAGKGSDKGLDKSEDAGEADSDDPEDEGAGQDASSEDTDMDTGVDTDPDADGDELEDESDDADGSEAGSDAADEDAEDAEPKSEGGSLLDDYHRDDSWDDDEDDDTDLGDDPFDDIEDEAPESGSDVDDDEIGDDTFGGAADDSPEGESGSFSNPDEVSRGLQVFGGHAPAKAEPPDFDERKEERAIEREINRAVTQEPHFDEPTFGLVGINLHRDFDSTSFHRYYGEEAQVVVPEGELATALMHMRVAFSDNAKARKKANLKNGRVNGRVLGRRVPVEDERLFYKKREPGRRDYFVLIGLDISGSTWGPKVQKIKAAALAQAELCNRLGIDFAVYAHSGSGTAVELWEVKGPREPWTTKTREKLLALNSCMANLDGHTLEFYRKVLDKVTATDKIIMYYTDGAMPAENYEEELHVLKREIKTCAQKGYMLVGVGIDCDDPVKYGLDTILVKTWDKSVSVPYTVVKGLKERLIARSRAAA